MQGIKLVVFDFDQTLMNSQKGFDVAFEKIMNEFKIFLKKYGYNIKIEDFYHELKNIMRDLDKNKQYDRNLWWNILLKKIILTDNKFSDAECKRLTAIYWNTTLDHSELYPDTLEILNYLKAKQYLLGLLTDTDGAPGLKHIRLKKSGILQYFDGIIIGGEDIPEIKPDPAPYLKLASQLGVSPDTSVIIGDKPFTDINGGKKAGFHTILILRDIWEIEPKPDFQISELTELKSIL